MANTPTNAATNAAREQLAKKVNGKGFCDSESEDELFSSCQAAAAATDAKVKSSKLPTVPRRADATPKSSSSSLSSSSSSSSSKKAKEEAAASPLPSAAASGGAKHGRSDAPPGAAVVGPPPLAEPKPKKAKTTVLADAKEQNKKAQAEVHRILDLQRQLLLDYGKALYAAFEADAKLKEIEKQMREDKDNRHDDDDVPSVGGKPFEDEDF